MRWNKFGSTKYRANNSQNITGGRLGKGGKRRQIYLEVVALARIVFDDLKLTTKKQGGTSYE